MNIDIKKNFLPIHIFNDIKKIVSSHEFPWLYSSFVAEENENNKNSFYFIHNLYLNNQQKSKYFYLIFPIISRIKDWNTIIRARILMYTKKEKFNPDGWHSDFGLYNKACLLNLDTCNGHTLLKDGTKVDSLENQLYTFDGRVQHASVAQTDKKVRRIISINLG